MSVPPPTDAEHIAELLGRVRDLEAELAAAQQAPPVPEVGPCPFPHQPATLGEFVTQILRPMLTDTPNSQWCEQWELHPLPAYLFSIAYQNWPHPLLPEWAELHQQWATHLLPLLVTHSATFASCNHGAGAPARVPQVARSGARHVR